MSTSISPDENEESLQVGETKIEYWIYTAVRITNILLSFYNKALYELEHNVLVQIFYLLVNARKVLFYL